MLSITKIFRFEAAHALYDYPGPCSRVHGHSYELHVKVGPTKETGQYLPGTGIVYDFKDLKSIVQEAVIKRFDHQLIVSEKYISQTHQGVQSNHVQVFEAEPSAENLLLFIRNEIQRVLPAHVRLLALCLWETRDSYAEWSAD